MALILLGKKMKYVSKEFIDSLREQFSRSTCNEHDPETELTCFQYFLIERIFFLQKTIAQIMKDRSDVAQFVEDNK